MKCPMCEQEAINVIQLKNGTWTIEPLSAYEVDPFGHICADWDEQHLDIYVHDRTVLKADEQ